MLGKFLRRDAPADEERALQIFPWGDWSSSAAGPSQSGVSVSADNAVQQLTVYGCVSLISDTIATLPRVVYRENGDTKKEVPAPRWVEQPNDYSNAIDFVTQTLVSLLLDGNAYWTYEVDRNLAPTALHVIAPARIDVRASNGGGQTDNGSAPAFFVDGQLFRGRMIHIKGITRPGMLKGLSPVEAARQSIGIGLAAQEYAARFYSNGASLSGVIETPGDLTLAQAQDLVQKFGRDHSGLQRAHKPGVLDNGARWNAISVTPEQAQFLQSREFQAAEIAAQLFLVDPAFFSISTGRGQNLTYANQEQRGVHLAQFTLMRWIVRLEAAYTFLLPKPQTFKFNVDGLTRADLKTRYEAWQIALGGAQGMSAPWMTPDEIRELEDLDGPMPKPDPALVPPAQQQPAQSGGTVVSLPTKPAPSQPQPVAK